MVKEEIDKNRIINDQIVVHIKERQKVRQTTGEVDLSALKYDKPAALLKYLSHCPDT